MQYRNTNKMLGYTRLPRVLEGADRKALGWILKTNKSTDV